jgi:hypothetical protein
MHEAQTADPSTRATLASRILAFVAKEFREMLPPTLFLAVGFNLIVLTTQLVLDDYFVYFANFMVATGAALVVGKSVLMADLFPFLRRYNSGLLIRPILFKTVVYTLVVLAVRFLERVVEYLIDGGTIAGFPEYFSTHFTWHRFAAIQIWIFVLFLIYTTGSELSARLGRGELARMLFTSGANEPVGRN